MDRPADLRRAVRAAGARVVGVVGFSGSWRHNRRSDAERVAAAVLERLFAGVCAEHPVVWCASGATDLGVPALAYRAAAAAGIPTVGITAEAASAYPIAPLDRLVVVGRRFGDESRVFVSACHEIWMIGGGPQSEAEVRLADTLGLPTTVVTGLGGHAERLDPAALSNARFLDADTLCGNLDLFP